jgi:ParB family transcriptional regulator, chromosome partitioning protein
METQIIPLARIVEAPLINPRRTKSSVTSLKASIAALGLQQRPAVRPKGDGFQIVFGSRRLRALRELAKEGVRYPGQPEHAAGEPAAEVVVLGDKEDATAQEIALAENVQREDLHPIDEFEGFAALLKAGQTPEALAARFGKSLRGIKQRLALGTLAPEIIAAWRAGELRDDSAQAFTLTDDQKRQVDVYQRLKKQNNLWAHAIRSSLGADHSAAEALAIVGVEAYRAAGGKVTEDLFGAQHAVSDPKLAQKLLAEKIEATCRELEADGWSFAIERGAAANYYLWPKLAPKVGYTADERKRKTESAAIVLKYRERDDDDLSDEERAELEAAKADGDAVEREALLRAFKPELRKKAGCFVYAQHGELKIVYGVQRPATAKAEAKKAAKEKGEAPAAEEAAPTISHAVATDLSAIRTTVAAQALAADPLAALRLLYATLISDIGQLGPMRIIAHGMPQLTPDASEEISFAAAFETARDLDLASLAAALAVPLSQALDLRTYNAAAAPDDEDDAVVASIDAAEWRQRALERFSPEDYFGRIPVPLIKDALIEMMGSDYEPRGKKGELAAAAVAAQKQTAWLPPQLRHPSDITAQA